MSHGSEFQTFALLNEDETILIDAAERHQLGSAGSEFRRQAASDIPVLFEPAVEAMMVKLAYTGAGSWQDAALVAPTVEHDLMVDIAKRHNLGTLNIIRCFRVWLPNDAEHQSLLSALSASPEMSAIII